jgi:hypothetical protein
MKEINICIEDATLAKAEMLAKEQSMTVSQIIQKYLDQIVSQPNPNEGARKRLLERAAECTGEVGPRTWTRADLYDR